MENNNIFSKEELSEILHTYGLGELISYEYIKRGTVQDNIMLISNSQRCVLKYYKSRSIPYVEFETKLIEYLNVNTYCCPKILQNKEGKLLGYKNEKAFTLYQYVEGEHLETFSRSQFHQLIQKIAELHLLTSDLQIEGYEHRWNYDIDFCKSYIDENLSDYKEEGLARKIEWLYDVVDKVELPTNLVKGIVHGDLDKSNIFFKEDKIESIIDFDDANYSYLLFDIICLIDSHCDSFLDESYFETARIVIGNYDKIRKLSQLEKLHLFDVLKLSIVIDCFWFFERGLYPKFREKAKIDQLNQMGRQNFYDHIFL